MTYQIKMTYTEPTQLSRMKPERDESLCTCRIPGHPTRPAVTVDTNTWWEDITPLQATLATDAGCIVRLR